MKNIVQEDKEFFEKIYSLDAAIEKEKQNKVTYLRTIISQIESNAAIFKNLFEKNKDRIEKEIIEIGEKLNFKIPNYSDKFGVSSILNTIEGRLPIKTDSNDYISEDLPRVTEDWIFENYESTSQYINWGINPIDNSVRYPVDPDDNPHWFAYAIPRKVHIASLDPEKQEKALTDYFEVVVKEELESLENKILHKQKIAQSTISQIDFNDPIVVAELKNKLGNF